MFISGVEYIRMRSSFPGWHLRCAWIDWGSSQFPVRCALPQIPAKKVKLVIGPGGSKIQEIQKATKCRIQVKKDEVRRWQGNWALLLCFCTVL